MMIPGKSNNSEIEKAWFDGAVPSGYVTASVIAGLILILFLQRIRVSGLW
jgi:hypothetical protein